MDYAQLALDVGIDGKPLRSFLKWAGGKTRIAQTLAVLTPPEGYQSYIEPFCGSAAVFFALRPEKAVLADANEELIVCLRGVRSDPETIMGLLDDMPNDRRYFDRVRRQDVRGLTEPQRAARFIYLNKTAFRGLWRVNRKGEFNAPYGDYDRPYYNRETLLAASDALRSAELRCDDFTDVLADARPGDWVYLDPPYVPDRKWGDFTRYTPGQFGPQDQRRLASLLRDLNDHGVQWLLTNSNTPVVRDLYRGFHTSVLATRRDITLQSADRDSTDLVIANYAHPPHDALTPIGDTG